MTEGEWLSSTDPRPMMQFLRDRGERCERRCRLFACACLRRIWPLLPGPDCRESVEVAERFADGAESGERLGAALARLAGRPARRGVAASARNACWYAAFHAFYGPTAPLDDPASKPSTFRYDWSPASRASLLASRAAVWNASRDSQRKHERAAGAMRAARETEFQGQAALLRDLFLPLASPPADIHPSVFRWNDGAVEKMARAMYDASRFDALPVLADALEDAGCHDEALLNHCRGPAVHARGCWALDLLTGRR